MELADVVAFGVFGAGAGVVEVCAEVVESGLVVAEGVRSHVACNAMTV